MGKTTNAKKVVIGLIFILLGIGMLCFAVIILFPAVKHDMKVCTLQVDAVVVGNESHLKSDIDGGNRIQYSQIVKYTVNDWTIRQTIWNTASDPVPEGTVMTLWVDPENPHNFIKSRDSSGIEMVAMIVPITFILFGLLVSICNWRKAR